MKKCKKFLSLILCLCLFFNMFALDYIVADANNLNANSNTILPISDSLVNCDEVLVDNQNGSFKYTLRLTTDFSHSNKNNDCNVAQNSYFTVKQPGTYLIELWGGNGADGESTSRSTGGTGGKGGHIYGTIDLKAGETLFYSIGGNGTATVNNNSGGGANGPGGNHGDIGSYNVGGGGGYSAVYKFAPNEFESKYLDVNNNLVKTDIDEVDRQNKYVMIAAGGGGGGAGNGPSIGSVISGKANGGNGGNIDSFSGNLYGSSYAVEGTFFAGKDGKSSGTSTEYVGHGATNLPGAIANSILSVFSGEEPNDWNGTINPNYVGGAGGAGQFRGGAGGAGFCGGSGGMMPSLLIATNIGGGGGGSSFISKDVNYSNLSAKTLSKLKNKNNSTTGGAINITYVDDKEKPTSNKIEITNAFSEYIDVLSISSTSGNCIDWSDDKRCFSKIENVEISSTNVPTVIEFTFAPKVGFAGGNDVPIFMDDKINFTSFDATTSAELGTVTLNTNEKCSYFNCPILMMANGINYMTNDSSRSYQPKELYNDKYVVARTNPSQFWNLKFIKSIGDYVVTDEQGNLITNPVSPKATTSYNVSVDVEPFPAVKAVVGTLNSKMTLKDVSTITIVSSSSGQLNGNVINYTKSLEYDESTGLYNLRFELGAGSESSVFEEPPREAVTVEQVDYVVSSTSNIKPGYYLIQAWGGNGGDGYQNYGRYAGLGASGGYVQGFVHLSSDDILHFDVGKNGSQGLNSRAGGFGGFETRILHNGTPILVAGGGGGGGGYGGALTLIQGASAIDSTEIITEPGVIGSQNGGNGTAGSEYLFGDGGNAGISGKNYTSPLISQGIDKLKPDAQQKINAASKNDYTANQYNKNNSGCVYLTCVQLDADEETIRQEGRDSLSNYTLTLELSNYFDTLCNNVSYSGLDNAPSVNLVDKKLTLSAINPTITESKNVNNGTTVINLSFNASVKIPLKTIDGFLGGNDVPVLRPTDDSVLDPNMKLLQGTASIPIVNKNESDFANVNINYLPQLSVNNKTYISGDPVLKTSDLYRWENEPNLSVPLVADFVSIVEPNDEILTPNITTSYPIKVGLVPKSVASKATVISLCNEKTVTKDATVYVNYQVIYNLKNAITSQLPNENGKFIVESDKDFKVSLAGESGYSLPNKVRVLVKNTEITNYTYDINTGELVIPKQELDGALTIYADGVPIEYTLNYVYETSPGFGEQSHIEKYVAGSSITSNFAQTYVPKEYEGYYFMWDWSTYNNDPLTTMPSQNWWVVGQYVPKDYSLTVNYHKDNQIFNVSKSVVTYGSNYNVISPTIPGYVADIPAVNGVMPANDFTVDVYYTSTQNKLTIVYILSDTNKEYDRYSQTLNVGEGFDVQSPVIKGYTPDSASVNGVMTSDGYTQYVYYWPNTYILTFDANGGNCPINEKDIVYNRQYNYDGVSYEAFPTPVKLGYKFLGWYLGNVQIEEDTIVTTDRSHSLVAKWESQKYKVVVEYQYSSGEKASEKFIKEYEYGATYSVDSPVIKGYAADKLVVSGTIGAQNVSQIVTYTPNKYTLTINYLLEDGSKAFEPTIDEISYKSKYSYIPPTLTNYTCSADLVSGIMAAEDKVVNVYYYQDAPIINATIDWTEMTFDYTRGQWNTDTIIYTKDTIKPISNDNNKIVVTNNFQSTVPIIVEYSYSVPFTTLSGYFTVNNNAEDLKITQQQIPIGSTKSAYYWLDGTLDKDKIGNINAGECKVIIRGDR